MKQWTIPDLGQLAQRIAPGGRLLRGWPLTGGSSARVIALELQDRDGAVQRAVVRVHGDADFAGNPQIAADEFRLLQLLRAAAIPVPAPLHLESTGAFFGRPWLVTSFIDGTPEFDGDVPGADLTQMADELARLHRNPWTDADLAFLPPIERRIDGLLDGPPARDHPEARAIRAALQVHRRPAPANRATLLHGDYWPGNMLWRGGTLAAILDWEDAARGDPLCDLAIARLDLLFARGEAALHSFTRRYLAANPTVDPTALPAWDLLADLRTAFRLKEWHDDPAVVSRLEALHRWFMNDSLARLGR